MSLVPLVFLMSLVPLVSLMSLVPLVSRVSLVPLVSRVSLVSLVPLVSLRVPNVPVGCLPITGGKNIGMCLLDSRSKVKKMRRP